MAEIQDGSVDMVLCDLPYGTTECSWDSVIPFDQLWAHYKRVCKPTAAIVLTAHQPFTTELINSNRKMFRYCWVWIKSGVTGFGNAKKQPLRAYEDVVVFYQKQPDYKPLGIVKLDKPKRQGHPGAFMGRTGFRQGYETTWTNYPRNILTFASERGFHPTQKPVALFEYLIRTYTNPGELVLDNCMGSGTTAIAAINTGRDYIGFETDEVYYRTATERIAGHQATLLDVA